MKTVLVPCLLSTFSLLACKSEKSCSIVKNGDFYFERAGASHKVQVMRNGKVQQEIEAGTGDTTWLDVTWESACSYKLHFLKSTKQKSPEAEAMTKRLQISTTILHVSDAYYIASSVATTPEYPGREIKKVDTIWMQQ
jgi:hypothetical protein